MEIYNWLQKYADDNGIIAGICDASDFEHAHLLEKKETPFVSKNISKRVSPSLSLKNSKSIIAIGMKYATNFSKIDSKIGNISVLGRTEDYHYPLKAILKDLVEKLKNELDFDFKYKIIVDTGGLDERAIAARANLGFYGRHGMIISKKFGSRFYIGSIITNIPFQNSKNPESKRSCPPNCSRCIDACPTSALSFKNACSDCIHNPNKLGYGYFDSRKCISYITQKDEIDEKEQKMMGQQLYGCDICQMVCPFNFKPIDETGLEILPSYIEPEKIIDLDDDQIKSKLEKTTMLWRGNHIIKRNAMAVKSNIYLDI